MISTLNILSISLHNLQANLKILFDNNINIEITDYNILNKYVIYNFN